jgi:hypothetical protein
VIPPSSVTIAPAFLIISIISGTLFLVTRMSPCLNSSKAIWYSLSSVLLIYGITTALPV